jgi:hypothetical protein
MPAHTARGALQRMVDATNAGDNVAFLACFAEDAVIDDWGREFVGRDAIAGWNERENIGTRSHLELLDEVSGTADHTTTVRVTGGGYNGGGTFAVDESDGMLTRLVIRG